MTVEDIKTGWGAVPAGLSHWKCPSCGETSPTEEWDECYIECETCTDHEGRECPRCLHIIDSVYEDEEFAEAQKNP